MPREHALQSLGLFGALYGASISDNADTSSIMLLACLFAWLCLRVPRAWWYDVFPIKQLEIVSLAHVVVGALWCGWGWFCHRCNPPAYNNHPHMLPAMNAITAPIEVQCSCGTVICACASFYL